MNDVKIYKLANEYDDQHITDVAIGHRLVELRGVSKEIIAIVIRGTNGTVEEWSSNFDIGCDDIFYSNNPISRNTDWTNVENHMGFDIAATRVIRVINEYISEESNLDSSAIKTLWITGHSRGAGIANIVGSELDSRYETFVYTFASPMTTTVSDIETASHKSIFNIVNGDDIIPCLPLDKWGFKRYGNDKIINVSNTCKSQWEKIAGSYSSNVGNLNGLLEKFGLLAQTRNDCYKYTCSCHGNGEDDSICSDLNMFSFTKYAEKYCIISNNEFGEQHICQTTAFFMQYLAYLAAEASSNYLILLIPVAPKYSDAKWSFVKRSANVEILKFNDYTTNPHEPISYYVLSKI